MVKLIVVVLVALVATSASPETRRHLVFDAPTVQAGQSGPKDYKPGHVDSSSGTLQDAAGAAAGRWAVTCVVVKVLSASAVLQRCTGSATTPDGRLTFDGKVPTNVRIPTLRVTGVSGAYRGASGTIREYQLSDKDALVTVDVAGGAKLRAGVVTWPAANNAFRARAETVCAVALRRLAAVHELGFAEFEGQRPGAARLRSIGKFLVAADARPVLRSLDAGLVRLGSPPAHRAVWARFVAARTRVVAAYDGVVRAAQAANVDAFVKAARQGATAVHDAALAALVFGAPGCVL